MSKKEYEVACCKFFADRILSPQGLYLSTIPNEIEDSEIDVHGYIGSQRLGFQVVTSSGEVEKASSLNTRAYSQGRGMRVMTPNDVQWILEALQHKERSYSDEVKRNLILIIEGGYPALSLEEAESIQIPQTQFRGVYFVRLPANAFPESSESRGFVTVLKDAGIRKEAP